MENVLLEMKGISKSFPGVKALKSGNLTVYKGRVMALLGENGAGKSTLMNILSGVFEADGGEIFYQGKKVSFKNTHQSAGCGIAMIHQELNLIPRLSAAENLFLGREFTNRFGKLDKKKIYQKSQELLKKVRLDILPDTIVKDLSVGARQMIEIAKSFTIDANLIIMDEPTASLVDRDVERLFDLIAELKKEGKSIIYISHRLDEIFKIADDVTVMRDGEFVSMRPIAQTNEEQLIEDIVGRKVGKRYPFVKGVRGKKIFEFKNLVGKNIKNSSGAFYEGQTVGFSGLVGSGRTELARAIFGAYNLSGGGFFIDAKSVKIKTPKQALKYGIVYLSEDRKGDGLVLSISVLGNATLSSLKSLESKLLKINKKKEKSIVKSLIEKLYIKTPSGAQIVKNLSGGNQQKVALARALMVKPKLLILDEPTRGIDVGAKKEIYDLINELKSAGMAILMISSDMNEILGLSDRVMVFCEGKITANLEREDASSERIMSYAIGGVSSLRA